MCNCICSSGAPWLLEAILSRCSTTVFSRYARKRVFMMHMILDISTRDTGLEFSGLLGVLALNVSVMRVVLNLEKIHWLRMHWKWQTGAVRIMVSVFSNIADYLGSPLSWYWWLVSLPLWGLIGLPASVVLPIPLFCRIVKRMVFFICDAKCISPVWTMYYFFPCIVVDFVPCKVIYL